MKILNNDPMIEKHEDIFFYNERSKLTLIIKYFQNNGASNQEVTHLIFMRKQWEENFSFKNIDEEGKRFIEDRITTNFFTKYK